ncbi:MAG: hypothetical protein Q7S95_00570 [bacterium]|nr:hypothetical protein [bacterium]
MYFILISLGLVVGYSGLLTLESRRGARFFASHRARLDQAVEQGTFIVTHVDFASFAREEAMRFAHRLTHDLAHLSLTSVRILERLLTRLVRHLRAKNTNAYTTPQESTRPFVRTLSEFKGHIKATRPEMPDIR